MRLLQNFKRALQIAVLAVPAFMLTLGTPMTAFAAVQNAAPEAKLSCTFDDGYKSIIDQAVPTLAKYGLTGTSFVVTNCMGMITVPNTCRADTNKAYMTWAQVQAVQNTYGWEIGSHTATHPLLASSDATEGQPNVLTPAQVTQELTQSKADLAAHGIDAKTIASPYGDYSNATLAQIAKVYEGHRGFADVGNNLWSYNDLLMNNMQVQSGVTVAQVKARIDQAITNKEWLVLTFHDIKVTPSTAPTDYEYATSNLDQIAAYAKSKIAQIKTINLKNGFVKSDVNAMPNGTLANGINDGWTTNTPANVTADSGNNGSFPESTKSVKMTAGATNAHLFSPKIAVDSTQNYMFKSFLNVTSRTAGELGYYIDEYDAAGNWISGQWKKAETTVFVENVNFTYQPTSANVKKASLQIYNTANSGITAYVDNFQFFSLTGTTTPPPAPVTTTDIMTNGTFDAGIASGWTTDNATAFAADSANHGSPANATKSVKMTAGTTNAHLFSPRIDVATGVEYTLKSYLNVATRTANEVGYYIDEYDVNGNWISGKYIHGKTTVGAEDITYGYIPSSANVKKASWQVILPANSGITGYFDNAQWLAPAGTVVTPTPPTTPTEPTTPTPTPTNLVANGTFDAGLASGWTTNTPANVTADATNNGSTANPVNSIKMTSSTTNTHLFSPKIAVSSTKNYSLTSYLNLQSITAGELGYYIDEYDAAGNWISGQWKKAETTVGARDVALSYTPSSANVATASLQVYTTGNSGVIAFVDNVRWYQN
ncbi:MAG: polysaccharide deacetylase family protein [Candidatus Saccharimonadales bacterium]